MKRTRFLIITCFALAIGSAFTTKSPKRLTNPIGYASATFFGETNASDCAIGHTGSACFIDPDGTGPYSPVYDSGAHYLISSFKLKRVN